MAQLADFEDDDDLTLVGSLDNILEQKSLKWIFVGGKGGVGKTTTSCSLALMLATQRPQSKILIISTDPAHNLSDAYGQQFGPQPIGIHGVANLSAMEIDPKVQWGGDDELQMNLGLGDEQKSSLNFLSELSSSIPGIDEAMAFNALIQQVKRQDFDVIVFDTAPTGHTLRLLSFPTVLEKALDKLDGLKNKFGGLFSTVASALNPSQGRNKTDFAGMSAKLEDTKKSIKEIKKTFEDDDLTTFICVCIPEFLSLYETERLVQKLAKFGIDVHNIVINQVLFPEKAKNKGGAKGGCVECSRCRARVKMQAKYIEQFNDLYPDFHLTQIPLMSQEVRHLNKLRKFAHLLLNPYEDEYAKEEFDEDTFFADFNEEHRDEDDAEKDGAGAADETAETEQKTDGAQTPSK